MKVVMRQGDKLEIELTDAQGKGNGETVKVELLNRNNGGTDEHMLIVSVPQEQSCEMDMRDGDDDSGASAIIYI